MKRNLLLAGAVAAAAIIPGAVSAQHHPAHQKPPKEVKTLFNTSDSTKVYTALFNNAPQEFVNSGVPKFAIMGKEDAFYLAIGGYLKATAGYDTGADLDNPNEFVTADIPMNPAPGDKGKFNISAMQSHIYLNFVALPNSDNQFGAFIGMNFLDNYSPSLQYAYLKYRGITAGYDYTLFSDPAAGVPTIDYEGPSSSTAIPTATVNYTREFGKHKEWKFGAGVEMPMVSYTTGAGVVKATQKAPAIPAYLQYSWSKGSGWIRLSAILRNMFYRNELSAKTVDKVGWGVQLTGSTPIVAGLTAYYQGVVGKGIASFIQDLNGGGMDLCPDPNRPGALKAVTAWGAYGGLQYNFTDNVFCSATYSQVRTYADQYNGGATAWGDQYRYAQYVVGNVFWNINSLLQTGVEYIYGRRVDYSGAQSHTSRIQAMLQLSF